MAFGNLQRPIITSVSFSVIKTPSLISKNALYFYFSYFVMSFVFLPQYFLIIFNPTSSIFECPSFVSISLILCHNSITFFSFMIFYCFNTTFSPCFFCNFYNHFTHTQEKKYNFNYIKCLIIFDCFHQLKSLTHFLIFIFSNQI